MRITDFVTLGGVHRLRADGAAGALRELGLALAGPSRVAPDLLVELLQRRERVCTTAVGHEVAMPHARTPDAGSTTAIIGLAPAGIDFLAPDGLPVRIFVVFVSPIHGGRLLQALAAAARDLADPDLRRRLLLSSDAAEVLRLLGAAPRPTRSRT